MTTLAEKWAEFEALLDIEPHEKALLQWMRDAFLCGASAALVCIKESACAAGTIATTNMALGPVKAELERLEKSGEDGLDEPSTEV